MSNKIYFYALLVVLASFYSYPSIASADGTFSGCDYTADDTGSIGPNSADCNDIGAAGRTLYAVEVEILTYAAVPAYVKVGYGTGVSCTPFASMFVNPPTGPGHYVLVFQTPQLIGANFMTANLQMSFMSNAGCSSQASGITFGGNSSPPPNWAYTIYHYSPVAPSNINTRIDLSKPYNGEYVSTSTPFDIGAIGYINPDDFVDGMEIEIELLRTGSQIRAFANNYVVGIGSTCFFGVGPFCFWDPTVEDGKIHLPVNSDGTFDVSTTTPGFGDDLNGRISMQIRLDKPQFSILGFEIGETTIVSTTTYFVIGELSGWDTIEDTAVGSIDAILNNPDPLSACQFDFASVLDFSSSSNLFNCLAAVSAALLIPNASQATSLVDQARAVFLYKAPWGYGTLVYDMFNAPIATSSLPQIDLEFPEGLPVSGMHLDLTPWGDMAGVGSRLAEAEDPDGNPVLPTLLNAWNNFCYFMFGLYLLGLFHKEPEDNHSHA